MDATTGLHLSWLLGAAGAIAAALGVLGNNYFNSRLSEASSQRLNGEIAQLKEGNVKLQEMVQPFVEYARAKYPTLDPQDALEKVRKELGHLKLEINRVKRGATTTYDFNGAKRITKPGFNGVDAGEEFTIFQELFALVKAEKRDELILKCEKQIKRNQEWLTPYFYLGIAYADAGRKNDAIKMLKYVLEQAPDNPDYAQAKVVLKTLGGK